MLRNDAAPDLAALAHAFRSLANEKRLRLLRYLLQPHYVEEIASELGVARQTAQEHVDQLLDAGLLERVRGKRETGAVTEYVVSTQRLFLLQEDLADLCGEPAGPDLRHRTEVAAPGPAPPRPHGPRLVVLKGRRVGQARALAGEGPWLVGRDPAAHVCLDYDLYASLRHAEVRRERGRFVVVDLFSSNGTSVDWVPVPRGGSQEVENGSILQVGKSLLALRLTPPPPAPHPS